MSHSSTVAVITESVGPAPSPGMAIALAGARPGPAILDSSAQDPRFGRYTIVACEPIATFEHACLDGNPFEAMRSLLAATHMLGTAEPPADVPFAGGWIGYFAYEAGRFIERLPCRATADVGLPVARFGLYDSAAVYDHVAGGWRVVAADLRASEPGVSGANPAGGVLRVPTGRAEADPAQRIRWWKALLEQAAAREAARPSQAKREGASTPLAYDPPPAYGPPQANLTREQHLRAVVRARAYIAAGDIFQVNLARRESAIAAEDPLDIYLRLRQTNPGAWSAFLSWKTEGIASSGLASPGRVPDLCAVLSSSPELFLELRGRQVVTRPIKGTRPRSPDPATDERLRFELAGSSKDRAELAMIVDLERNDLGRVCEFGSIRVVASDSPAAPFDLERHPTVHHLVATVTGRLAGDRDAIDLLQASFPGGSITGAPKIRAMEIIDELEPSERSVYTGAIGYFAPGRMVMNIAIRTLIQSRGLLHWYTGGGIVADSDPAAEYDETCAKALGMRRALGLAPDR